jgi:hypothetical protein
MAFTRTIRSLIELKADIKSAKKAKKWVDFMFTLQGKTKGSLGVILHTVSQAAFVSFFEDYTQAMNEFQVVAYHTDRGGVEYVLEASTAK